MLVSCEEMRRREEAAFARGVSAADLMEEAGRGLAEIVWQFHPAPGHCVAYCGKGNNAGDALVALKYLRQWGWEISVALAFAPEDFSELPARHYRALENLTPWSGAPRRGRPIVVLDGLLGVGAKGAPRGPLAAKVEEINRLRRGYSAWVLAIDIPSGLHGDTGEPAEPCVEADLTATIGAGKLGLVVDTATRYVGRLALIPLPALEVPAQPESTQLATAELLHTWLPPRCFDAHKGTFGRVGIIAGSAGFPGAARLCSAAAVKAGAGLVTLYVKPETQPILGASCIPEVMVKAVRNYRDALEDKLDVLAIGPGLGLESASEVSTVIHRAKQPVVVDADALNILSRDVSVLKYCSGPRLLTPHPGEMERLSPQRSMSRSEWLKDFLARYPVTLLLKGARSIIGSATGERFYNTTGHPGMGTGGMGDVLTGVAAALLAQLGEEETLKSGALAAWICGRAAERAIFQGEDSPESLCASSVIQELGGAFADLRARVF